MRREEAAPLDGTGAEAQFSVRAFPGAADGVLRFGCDLDEHELPPQIEILLQVIVDAVEAAFVRIHTRSPAVMVRVVSPASG
jgi:hypothetical protein